MRIIALLYIGLAIAGCTAYSDPESAAGSPQDPPIPTTPSVIPLHAGNEWRYSYSRYDSTGTPIEILRRITLDLSITRAYKIVDPTTLTEVTWDNYATDAAGYAYTYIWDNQDSGVLISHRGNIELEKRGLYVIGDYFRGSYVLLDTPYLWLAYPAQTGRSWSLPGNSATIELVSTEEEFYSISNQSSRSSPLTFRKCYHYKETKSDTVSHYYYHPEIGALGYRQYVHGRLLVTSMLKEYWLNKNGNYAYD